MKEQRKTNYSFLYYQRNDQSICSSAIEGTKSKRSICSSTIKGTKTNQSICSSTIEGTKTKRSICSSTFEGTKTKRSICSSTIKGTKTKRSIRSSTIDDLTLLYLHPCGWYSAHLFRGCYTSSVPWKLVSSRFTAYILLANIVPTYSEAILEALYYRSLTRFIAFIPLSDIVPTYSQAGL